MSYQGLDTMVHDLTANVGSWRWWDSGDGIHPGTRLSIHPTDTVPDVWRLANEYDELKACGKLWSTAKARDVSACCEEVLVCFAMRCVGI